MQNIKKILLILTFVMGMTGLYGKDENTIKDLIYKEINMLDHFKYYKEKVLILSK